MAVSLSKGGSISLSKVAPNLVRASVGLGWSPRQTVGKQFDLDACAFMLTGGKVKNDADFIFYNNQVSKCQSLAHQGDNRTGEGDGDDEVIKINLEKVPSYVEKIVFTVTIHEGIARNQNFGQVSDAYVRIVNDDDGEEKVRFDLTEDDEISNVVSMIFCEIYRHGSDWKLKAVGQGFKSGLDTLARNFGVDIE